MVSLTCQSCGGPLVYAPDSLERLVCAHCGHEYREEPVVTSAAYACPKCRLTDRTLSVSAIMLDSFPLAERLTLRFPSFPPLPPQPERPLSLSPSTSFATLVILTLAAALIFLGGLVFHGGWLWAALIASLAVEGYALLASLPALFPDVVMSVYYQRMEAWEALARERRNTAIGVEKVTAAWRTAYYCQRCGVVYLPGRPRWAAPETMLDYFIDELRLSAG